MSDKAYRNYIIIHIGKWLCAVTLVYVAIALVIAAQMPLTAVPKVLFILLVVMVLVVITRSVMSKFYDMSRPANQLLKQRNQYMWVLYWVREQRPTTYVSQQFSWWQYLTPIPDADFAIFKWEHHQLVVEWHKSGNVRVCREQKVWDFMTGKTFDPDGLKKVLCDILWIADISET